MTVVAETSIASEGQPVPVEERSGSHLWRSLPGWVGQRALSGCQRCAEVIVSRPLVDGVMGVVTWPFLSTAWHYAELGVPAAIVSTALVGGRRQSLLTLADVIKFRYRVTNARRKFTRVIGRNAAISKALTAHDTVGNPTKSPGKDVPKLRRFGRFYRCRYIRLGPRRTPFGMVVTIDGVNIGAVAPAFEAECGVIAGSFGAVGAEVHKHEIFQELTQMSLTFEDPFRKTIPYRSLPAPSEPELVVVGRDRDHHPVEQSLWVPMLAVGESGSGKSSWAHVILAGIIDQNMPVRLWIYDPKGGVEFYDYEDTAYRYARSPYLWVELLRELIETMQDKLDRMRGRFREAPAMDPEFGIDVLLIDELLAIFNFIDNNDKKNLVKVVLDGKPRVMKPMAAFNHLLSQCRAARIAVIALSQAGGKDNIKNRSLFPRKTIFRTADDETVTMLGFKASVHRAHEIPGGKEFAGYGFCKTIRGVSSFRAAFLDDRERAEVARRVGVWTDYYQYLNGDGLTDLERVELEIRKQQAAKRRIETELESLVAKYEAANSA